MRKRKTKFWSAFSILLVAIGIFIFTSKDLSIHGYDEQTSKEDSVSQSTNSNVEKVNLDGYLFLGDSYTFLLKETIESHNPKASVCAKSGVQPVYWNENFNTLPDNEQVNGVVLLIGVNGVTYDDNLPNKKMLIDSLVEKYQNKTIYVQKVFPVGENFENANPVTFNAAIKSHNEEIENYCQKYDNVIFIDSTKDLVTDDGYLKYTYDGLHISTDKQEVFYNNIEDAINNINQF